MTQSTGKLGRQMPIHDPDCLKCRAVTHMQDRLLKDLAAARGRQIERHGDADLPEARSNELYVQLLQVLESLDTDATFEAILLEEVVEVVEAASDDSLTGNLREELLDVMTVCARWIQQIDRLQETK